MVHESVIKIIIIVVIKRVSTVFWETFGKIWETVLVLQNTLKNTDHTRSKCAVIYPVPIDSWVEFAEQSKLIIYGQQNSDVRLNHICRVRVTSPSSQSHIKSFRAMTWSSRVRVESQGVSSHFEWLFSTFESMSSQMKFNIFPVSFFTTKWRPMS